LAPLSVDDGFALSTKTEQCGVKSRTKFQMKRGRKTKVFFLFCKATLFLAVCLIGGRGVETFQRNKQSKALVLGRFADLVTRLKEFEEPRKENTAAEVYALFTEECGVCWVMGDFVYRLHLHSVRFFFKIIYTIVCCVTITV
jgi:hypothetical protein